MWYVIQTMSGKEFELCSRCQQYVRKELYHRMFVPRYVRKRKYRGVWHEDKKVLFPGYFFIDTEQVEEVMASLSKVADRINILRMGDMVAAITKEEQSYLEDMLDEDDIVQMTTGFFVGDGICITEGPLKNYQGYIKRIDRHRRVADLDINFFGRMTPVQVGFEVLAKVSEEEFKQMKEESAKELSDAASSTAVDKLNATYVRVICGVFSGMTGRVLSRDMDKKEWKVSLNLFGNSTTVTFAEDEISRI